MLFSRTHITVRTYMGRSSLLLLGEEDKELPSIQKEDSHVDANSEQWRMTDSNITNVSFINSYCVLGKKKYAEKCEWLL